MDFSASDVKKSVFRVKERSLKKIDFWETHLWEGHGKGQKALSSKNGFFCSGCRKNAFQSETTVFLRNVDYREILWGRRDVRGQKNIFHKSLKSSIFTWNVGLLVNDDVLAEVKNHFPQKWDYSEQRAIGSGRPKEGRRPTASCHWQFILKNLTESSSIHT